MNAAELKACDDIKKATSTKPLENVPLTLTEILNKAENEFWIPAKLQTVLLIKIAQFLEK